jgi:hypothetical protein
LNGLTHAHAITRRIIIIRSRMTNGKGCAADAQSVYGGGAGIPDEVMSLGAFYEDYVSEWYLQFLPLSLCLLSPVLPARTDVPTPVLRLTTWSQGYIDLRQHRAPMCLSQVDIRPEW